MGNETNKIITTCAVSDSQNYKISYIESKTDEVYTIVIFLVSVFHQICHCCFFSPSLVSLHQKKSKRHCTVKIVQFEIWLRLF